MKNMYQKKFLNKKIIIKRFVAQGFPTAFLHAYIYIFLI